jgi:mRNA-degrading endonuclease YafQ of YafQ-DinJ toxin-antitoxin module
VFMPDHQARWTIFFTREAQKQKNALPPAVADALDLLRRTLAEKGPHRAEWRNYSLIKGKRDTHHCHLNGGKPRYVAVWKVTDKTIRIVEVIHVGTHEGAHYGRMD